MKSKLVVFGAGTLLVLIIILAGFVFHPFASAGPPLPTPVPDKALSPLDVDVDALKEAPSTLAPDASVSQAASACGSIPVRKIFYATADAEIRQGYPNTNYGSSDMMRCGYDDYYDPDGQIMRCLTGFDVSSLPANATINSAALYLLMFQSWDFPGRTRTYTAYRIPSDWSESTVTWSNAPSPAEAYGSTGVTHEAWGWYSLTVTSLVQAWNNGTYPNYGIMLRGPEWSGSDSSWKAFATKEFEYEGEDAPPLLVVDYEYTPPTPPTLGVSPTLLRFQAYGTGPNPEPQAVTIGNITVGSLDWSATKVGGASWLGLDRTSGTATPSSPDIMNASVNISGLAYGTYTERIAIIKTSDPTDCSNRFVDVVLEYGPVEPQKVFLPVVSKDGDGTPPPRDAVALVIGIADYLHCSSGGTRAGIWGNDLEWSDDDAQDVYNRLILEGFDSAQIRILTESDATYAAIENAINWLDTQENEGTLVFFHYSGHGGQITDDNGDEMDGKDEVIIPWDMYDDFELAIRDDQLDEWFSMLESKHVVVSLDSCYSAGMADPTGSAASRGIGIVLGTQSEVARVAEGDGFAQDISQPGRVVLAASPEYSSEFSALGNGVFTYFFEQALAAMIADGNGDSWISAEEAFSYLECRVDNYVYDHSAGPEPYHQNPQLYDNTIGEERIVQP
jgi:hypothetical protein